MTVSVQEPIIQHTANGSTTVFAYNFLVLSTDDFEVYLDDVLQGSGFSISGIGVNTGGSVTFSTAPASGVIVTLLRAMDLKRETDYQNSGDFRADTVNFDFDRVWLALQQVQRILDRRALLFPATQVRTTGLNTLPAPVEGQVLFWSSGTVSSTPITELVDTLSYANSDQVFFTLGAMKSTFDPNISSVARTLGFYNAGDGGHAEYYYLASSVETADDFLVVQPSSIPGRFKLIIKDLIHPKQAGCKFDGSADDSTNFNKCTSASNLLGFPIQLPAGTGIVKNIYIYSGTAIIGLGRQSKLKLKASAGASDWFIKNFNCGTDINGSDAAVPGDNNIVLHNFEIDGNKSNQTNAISTFTFRRVRYSILNKLRIINAKGVAFDGCNAIDHMFITENLFQNNDGVDIRILWVSNRNIIANNVIIGANLPSVDGGESGSVTSDAIQILAPNVTGSVNFNCAEDIIANNVIKGKVNGIVLDGAFETIIANNTMGTQTASAIVTKQTGTFTTEGLAVIGNQITQEAAAGAGFGLDLQCIVRSQISANSIFSQFVTCIQVGANAENRQVAIVGNNIRFAASQDVGDCINITDLGDSVIANNILVFGKTGVSVTTPSVGVELRSLRISDNRIVSPKRMGIWISNNGVGRVIRGVSIDDNHITNPGSKTTNTYDGVLIDQSGGAMSDISINGLIVHDFNNQVRNAVTFSGSITNMLCEPNIKAQGLNGVMVAGYYNSAPSSGSFYAGQRIYDFSPSAGGFEGWVCTASGSPGTWKTFGAISA